MSDYFSALLRSGGIAMPQTAPRSETHAAPLLPAELPLAAARLEAPPPQPDVQSRTPAPIPAALPAQAPSATPVAQNWQSRARPVDATKALSGQPQAGTVQPDSAPAPDTARAAEAPARAALQPPPSQALIDAAIQWVRASPQVSTAPAGSPAPPPLRHRRSDAPANAITQPIALDAEAGPLVVAAPSPECGAMLPKTDAGRSEARARMMPIGLIESIEPSERRAGNASMASLAIPVMPPAQAAPSRDDPVEVSIGTVHVHVEAPAPRAVVQRSPAPVTPQPAPTPARNRSGLARRALRRV
jgi:hypothetical protein